MRDFKAFLFRIMSGSRRGVWLVLTILPCLLLISIFRSLLRYGTILPSGKWTVYLRLILAAACFLITAKYNVILKKLAPDEYVKPEGAPCHDGLYFSKPHPFIYFLMSHFRTPILFIVRFLTGICYAVVGIMLLMCLFDSWNDFDTDIFFLAFIPALIGTFFEVKYDVIMMALNPEQSGQDIEKSDHTIDSITDGVHNSIAEIRADIRKEEKKEEQRREEERRLRGY